MRAAVFSCPPQVAMERHTVRVLIWLARAVVGPNIRQKSRQEYSCQM